MTLYLVTWAADIEADSPQEAAERAQALQQKDRAGYWVGVFTVTPPGGEPVDIDLDERTPA